MEPLGKVIEFLLKKHWVALILSFVATLVIHIFVPTKLYNDSVYTKLPFDYSINVILVFVGEGLILFLMLYGIQNLIRFFVEKSRRKTKEEYVQVIGLKDHKQIIEEFKTMADGWSDMDYSIVMYFLSNQNKKPYVSGYIYGASILNDRRYFHSTIETNPMNIKNRKGTIPVGAMTTTVTKYIMTKDFYDACKKVLEETGSLSHFDRKTIDLHQD